MTRMAMGSFVFVELCDLYLRRPDSYSIADDGSVTATFAPALTTQEQATFGDLQLMCKFGIPTSISLEEFQAIKPDLVTARQYVGLASPTQAQSAAALKATIRVLGALLRA